MAKILLVDDDSSLRCVVRFILEEAGHEIHEAGCGRDAARIYGKILPDLVLTDILMSPGDGFHVLRHVQSGMNCAPVPVIMITAFASTEQESRAKVLGVFEFLTKPCQKDQLCKSVNRALSFTSGVSGK